MAIIRKKSAPQDCPVGPLGEKLCKCGCGNPVGKGRRSWHSQECVDEWLIRHSPQHARLATYRRDKGVCAKCGRDTERARHRFSQAWSIVKYAALHYRYQRWISAAGLGRLMGPDKVLEIRAARITRSASVLDRLRRVAANRIDRMKHDGWPVFAGRRSWWECDHIVPVAHGGGLCGLDNLQTLCWGCHKNKTALQAAGKLALDMRNR